MSTQNDAIAILLANRSYLYSMLQRIFGVQPDVELIGSITNEHTREGLQLLVQEDDQQFDSYFKLFDQYLKDMSVDPKGTIEKLKDEYTYLLIGPNKLPAPPWESVYLTKERLIFQESTLKVRRSYMKYNFLPSNYPHEADDHLALELDFMVHLAKLSQEYAENEKKEELKSVLLDQKSFLNDHLLVWIGDFAEEIQQGKTQYFYPQMANLTTQVLKRDIFVLEELISLL